MINLLRWGHESLETELSFIINGNFNLRSLHGEVKIHFFTSVLILDETALAIHIEAEERAVVEVKV
jgi:hypothetical protein